MAKVIDLRASRNCLTKPTPWYIHTIVIVGEFLVIAAGFGFILLVLVAGTPN
jgi:hypothetical protein